MRKNVVIKDVIAVNQDQDLIEVRHEDLEPFVLPNSRNANTFARICPECEEGVLLGRRDEKCGVLSREDYCVICAQRFYYTSLGEFEDQGVPNESAAHDE